MEHTVFLLYAAVALSLLNLTVAQQDVFISEVMFDPRSNDDLVEYIELYNAGTTAVTLDDWTIPAVSWKFPAASSIAAGQYLLIAKNPAQLKRLYGLTVTPLGPYSGDLNNKGEKVELINVPGGNVVVHNVTYDVNPPWSPLIADLGSSLELACYVKPTMEHHWIAGPVPEDEDINVEYGGTPGKAPKWKVCLSKSWVPPYKVYFSEIMYAPVGNVRYEEAHEFIEIYNSESTPVDVSKWRIVTNSGMSFTFPANTNLAANSYATIAKDKVELTKVYGTIPGVVFGPYKGELANGKVKVAIIDSNGFAVDYVQYEDGGNWPYSPDALGGDVDELYPGNPFIANYNTHTYKGQSLNRRVWAWPTTSTYNWKEGFPSPGVDNTDSSMLPNVVVTHSPDIGKITASSIVTVTAELKPLSVVAGTALTATLKWFKQDVIFRNAPVINTVSMTYQGDALGTFTGQIPANVDNSIIRWFVTVDFKGGSTRRPRLTDPFQYHSYFVEPPPPGNTATPIYHMFVGRKDWSSLWTNINYATSVARVTDPCTERASWDRKVPAVFAYKGEVIDIRFRYQGSRWNRKNGQNLGSSASKPYAGLAAGVGPSPDNTIKGLSLNLDIPSWTSFHGHKQINLSKMWQGCTMFQTPLQNGLAELTGIATSQGDLDHLFARVNINGYYYRYMLVQGTDFAQWQAEKHTNNCLDHKAQLKPHLFKDKGANVDEAGWGIGDFRKLASTCSDKWTAVERYEKTYDRKTHSFWADSSYVQQTIEENAELTSATGATWLRNKLDLNLQTSFHALINWAGTWDNTFQNQFYLYREDDKKWFQSPWDADKLFGEHYGPTSDIYAGTPSFEPHQLRKNIIAYLKPELDKRFRLLQATVLSDAVITPLFDSIVAAFNTSEAALTPGGWGQDFNSCISGIRNYFGARRTFVSGKVQTWSQVEKTDPNIELAKVACPDQPTITRSYIMFNAPPGQPLEVQVKSKTYKSLEIQWINPNGWNTPITAINVEYLKTSAKRQSPTLVNLPATTTNFTLANPGGSATYSLTIAAVSAQGTGTPFVLSVVTDAAPVDCVWGDWSAWDSCSLPCGTGSQKRTRTIATPAANGGLDCTGPTNESQPCNTQLCPVDCAWNPWNTWSPCTATCGTANRSRTRTQTPAANGGLDCTGADSETENCTVPPCPVDCVWQPWSAYTACPTPCGGTSNRTRGSTNPENGGAPCSGTGFETIDCTPCPPPPTTPPATPPPGSNSTPETPPVTPGTPPATPPSGSNSTPGTPGEPGTPTPAPVPEEDGDDGPPVGIIVGVILGVTALAAIIAVAVYFFKDGVPGGGFETV